jgi:RNA polymerase sigma-32 factor
MGTTTAQRRIFYGRNKALRRIQSEARANGVELTESMLQALIAEALAVPLRDVKTMTDRLRARDASLDAPVASMEEEGANLSWIELLEEPGPPADVLVEVKNDGLYLKDRIREAVSTLPSREQIIIQERKLSDEPRSLESLGHELGISKERVRQLEAQALERLRVLLIQDRGVRELLS